MTRKNVNLLAGLLVILISIFFSPSQKSELPKPVKTEMPQVLQATDSAEFTNVIRVVDGDTIEIENGQKVRYIGINTPETVAPGKQVACFGHEASDKNKELVLGKRVRLEKDVSETDRYGRLLRYVYVDNEMINDELVKTGFAQASTYPPDVKYQELFLNSQRQAKETGLGLWGKCF